MKILGIYCITNRTNNKKYVGCSVNIKGRWRQHKHQLRNNKHCNSHLQASWNKYGETNFSFSILEEVESKAHIVERENFWITFYKSNSNGYN